MFTGESLSVLHRHGLVAGIQFVAGNSDHALFWRRLFQLLDPSLSLVHTYTTGGVVDDESGIGIPEVHPVENHVALLAWQVVNLKVDLLVERLNRNLLVLLHHRDCRLLMLADLLAKHALDD